MPTFKLKWTPEDPSHAIILTYHSKWADRIHQGNISVEFRKSGPNNVAPEIAYAYLASPLKAITARFTVVRFGTIPVKEAVRMSTGALLAPEEIRQYAKDRESLYFYQFSECRVATRQIAFQQLASEYGYFPSSNFFPLSERGRETLDRLGGFSQR